MSILSPRRVWLGRWGGVSGWDGFGRRRRPKILDLASQVIEKYSKNIITTQPQTQKISACGGPVQLCDLQFQSAEGRRYGYSRCDHAMGCKTTTVPCTVSSFPTTHGGSKIRGAPPQASAILRILLPPWVQATRNYTLIYSDKHFILFNLRWRT